MNPNGFARKAACFLALSFLLLWCHSNLIHVISFLCIKLQTLREVSFLHSPPWNCCLKLFSSYPVLLLVVQGSFIFLFSCSPNFSTETNAVGIDRSVYLGFSYFPLLGIPGTSENIARIHIRHVGGGAGQFTESQMKLNTGREQVIWESGFHRQVRNRQSTTSSGASD